jgi:hypothetical protein
MTAKERWQRRMRASIDDEIKRRKVGVLPVIGNVVSILNEFRNDPCYRLRWRRLGIDEP